MWGGGLRSVEHRLTDGLPGFGCEQDWPGPGRFVSYIKPVPCSFFHSFARRMGAISKESLLMRSPVGGTQQIRAVLETCCCPTARPWSLG